MQSSCKEVLNSQDIDSLHIPVIILRHPYLIGKGQSNYTVVPVAPFTNMV